MFGLTDYQRYLFIAYLIGVLSQVLILYVLSVVYCDELIFGHGCAIFYVVFATLQFLLFMKLIEKKGN